jgi:hypothetical protein
MMTRSADAKNVAVGIQMQIWCWMLPLQGDALYPPLHLTLLLLLLLFDMGQVGALEVKIPHQSIFELMGFQFKTGWQTTTLFPGWGILRLVQVISMGIRTSKL